VHSAQALLPRADIQGETNQGHFVRVDTEGSGNLAGLQASGQAGTSPIPRVWVQLVSHKVAQLTLNVTSGVPE
jgi:hypothetical protein